MMRVESVEERGGDVVVTTTGATFRFLADGRIEADQRLPSPRPCFIFHLLGGPWRVDARGAERVAVRCDAGGSEVFADSTVIVDRFAADGALRIRRDSSCRGRGRDVGLDEHGGSVHRRGSRDDRRRVLAVLPPRPPNREHLGWNLAHEGTPREPLPSDATIADAARTCRVLALHAYFWRAAPWRLRLRPSRYFLRSNSWRSAVHEPADPDALLRTMETGRRHGMKVVLYVSPLRTTAPDAVEEMARILDVHRPDGLYLDEIGGGPARQSDVVRRTRALLGPDRLLYLHEDAPPYVHAHADFVLGGSAGRRGLALDPFLRYAVSGWNVSGAVGVWCHYGSSGRVLPFERAPSAADVDLATRNHVRLWRRSRWGAAALRDFDARYGPAFARMVADERASLAAPPP